MKEREVTVGVIRKPHALKGYLGFESFLPDSDLFLDIKSFTLKNRGDAKAVLVECVRGSLRRSLIKFEGLDTLEAVEGLAGWKIVTLRSTIPPLPSNEFYHFDIIGMRVRLLKDRTELGGITAILETGANDVYIIQGTDGEEHLIPATKEVVKIIDIEKREMLISPLDGMIEGY